MRNSLIVLVTVFMLFAKIGLANSPYAPSSIGTTLTSQDIARYHYDAAGRRLSNNINGQTLAHGLLGKPTTIATPVPAKTTPDTEIFKYGSSGSRYLRLHADGRKTLYIGKLEYRIDGDKEESILQIHTQGYSPVAQVNVTHSNDLEYTYLVQDHLGSPVVAIDNDGSVGNRQRFDASGQATRPDGTSLVPYTDPQTAEKTPGFTGHETIFSANMIHMDGRVYDEESGFVAPDPILIEDHLLVSLNRYGYALNNGLAYIDVTGLAPQKIERGQLLYHGSPVSSFTEVRGLGPFRGRGGYRFQSHMPSPAAWFLNEQHDKLALGFGFRRRQNTTEISNISIYEYRASEQISLKAYESDTAMRDSLGLRDRAGVVLQNGFFNHNSENSYEYDGFSMRRTNRNYDEIVLSGDGLMKLDLHKQRNFSVFREPSKENTFYALHEEGSNYQLFVIQESGRAMPNVGRLTSTKHYNRAKRLLDAAQVREAERIRSMEVRSSSTKRGIGRFFRKKP